MKLKVEALFLVVLSLLVSVVRGIARNTVTNPKTIAVVNLTSNLGDMIMATPVFHALKSAHPNAQIIVVGTRKNKELLAGNSDIDAYIAFSDFWGTLFALSAFKPDVGVAMNPSPHELALLYLSGVVALTSFSHSAFESRAFRMLQSLAFSVPYTPGKNVAMENLLLLEPLGIRTTDTTKHLSVSADVLERMKTNLYKANIREFIVLAPGAGQEYREWGGEKFAEVAKYAAGKHSVSIAIAGGPSDVKFVKTITGAIPNINVFDGTKQSIEELKALVSLSKAVVANDSGIAYIAEACNVPAVIICGVSDPEEHPKGSPRAEVVTPPTMEYVLHARISNVDAVDAVKARAQFDAISVSSVTAALEHALAA